MQIINIHLHKLDDVISCHEIVTFGLLIEHKFVCFVSLVANLDHHLIHYCLSTSLLSFF